MRKVIGQLSGMQTASRSIMEISLSHQKEQKQRRLARASRYRIHLAVWEEAQCLTVLGLWCSRRPSKPCKSGTAVVGNTQGLRDPNRRWLGVASRNRTSSVKATPSI